MKRLCISIAALALLASCAPAWAQDLNVREFRRYVDARAVVTTDRLPWYAGESVGYTILSRSGTNVVQIPAGTVPVWTVLDAETNAYVVTTGTVVSATNGEVRFWLPAPQSNLPSGDYLSFATAYQGTNRIGVLDRAIVRVSWRPGDDFTASEPITNVLDQVIAWWADANALVSAASNNFALAIEAETQAREGADDGVQSNLTAHADDTNNPHGVTAEQIGALTEETDAAGLAAAAAAQSNLTAHADDTNNPHGVTAEQIGALTSESDPEFAAWEPSANVPVACAGGWLYPDFFTVLTTPYAETGISYSSTSEYNSILFSWKIVESQKGEVLSPEIIHQRDWTSTVSFTNAEVLEIREEGGTFYADWPEGTASGAVGRVTAILGDYSRVAELTFPGAGVATSNAWWVGDLPGSFRSAANTCVSNLAFASGKGASIFSGSFSATNFYPRSTNCWAASIDLTCASPWNSDWNNYKAGTAITPQHFLYAAHFASPTGTLFRWIDATNGIHDRTLVAQRFIGNDIAVGLLDSELPSGIAPAKCLSGSAIGVLRGMYGLKNAPGFRVIGLDAQERAWNYTSAFMENVAVAWKDAFSLSGSTNVPFSRSGAVGGDSGNPVFMTEGTNTILLSTFWTPNSGPFLPAFISEIGAAMVEMGGSEYTNWPAADLSVWPNYDSGANLPDY